MRGFWHNMSLLERKTSVQFSEQLLATDILLRQVLGWLQGVCGGTEEPGEGQSATLRESTLDLLHHCDGQNLAFFNGETIGIFCGILSLGPIFSVVFRDNKGNLLNLIYLLLEQTFDD